MGFSESLNNNQPTKEGGLETHNRPKALPETVRRDTRALLKDLRDGIMPTRYYTLDGKKQPQTPYMSDTIVGDRDYLRNESFIKENGISAHQEIVRIQGTPFSINVFQKAGKNNHSFVVLHDNEQSSFDTALHSITQGGQVISIENNEQRYLEGTDNIDPNRLFDPLNPYFKIGEAILALIGSGDIITLHNNTNNGGLSIENLRKNSNNISIYDAGDDHDNMIWISGSEQKPGPSLLSEINFYNSNGLNVVYEYVPKGKSNDHSLSNMASILVRPYYNIEIEHGRKKDQDKYLEIVLQYLDNKSQEYQIADASKL